MTDLLVDLASYQADLDLSRPAFAAWNRVNIKTSQGTWYIANRQRSRAWADQARALGKGIMTFHWLDNSASGAEQARIAFQEMRNLGGPDGMAHQADTEDDGKRYGPMTYRVWRDYVNAMQDLMGRHVINYTGDWWWPAGWDGASVTPYLMAAPNAGYFGSYPGDTSPHWNAGYGGWRTLAAMQFRVGPIPNGGPGAGEVSMTAIRDPQVWAALTGAAGGDDLMGVTINGEPIEQYLPRIERSLWWPIGGIAKDVQAIKAAQAAEATATAGLRAAVDAMAAAINGAGGSIETAGLLERIDARAAEVKALVEQRHAEEMAALKAERDAEVASLRARLDALTPAVS